MANVAEVELNNCWERRSGARHTLVLRIGVLEQAGKSFLCVVRNISSTGVQLKLYAKPLGDREASIRIADEPSIKGRIVWMKDDAAGINFDDELDPSTLLRVRQKLNPHRRRSMPRLPLRMSALLRAHGKRHEVSIRDISSLGARIGADHALRPGDRVMLELAGLPLLTAFVRWCDEEEVGLVFAAPIPMHILAHWVDDHISIAA